jgi:hypothetical protein
MVVQPQPLRISCPNPFVSWRILGGAIAAALIAIIIYRWIDADAHPPVDALARPSSADIEACNRYAANVGGSSRDAATSPSTGGATVTGSDSAGIARAACAVSTSCAHAGDAPAAVDRLATQRREAFDACLRMRGAHGR